MSEIRNQKIPGTDILMCWNPDCSYTIAKGGTSCLKCRWTADGPPGSKLPEVLLATTPRARAVALEEERDMNKTEARYKEHLEKEKLAGRIAFFDFECFKLRLADGCLYIPDFMVVDMDGYIELHDVKAKWKKLDKVHIEDDALVKMKTAGKQYPFFRVLAVWEEGPGIWDRRDF